MENKRYLIVTHGVDIDGMGPIVLARAAFGAGNIDAYFVNNVAETSDAVMKALSKIDEYDRVFVTDVCPSFETLSTIDGNEEYKGKVRIFDHHKYVLTDTLGGKENPFKFLKIEERGKNGPTCGTELFYEFLLSKGKLERTELLDELIENTRQYDTWDWKKTNNQNAWGLNVLFCKLGKVGYIENIGKKAVLGAGLFSLQEQKMIEQEKQKLVRACDEMIENMHLENVLGFNIGVIDSATDELKNDISERIREKGGLGIDAVAMLITARNSITMRTIAKGFDCSEFAKNYGGGGHAAAAGIPFSDEALSAFKFNIKQKEDQ